jgi:peptidyl-prolyl cis-trans isomerase SurA
MGPVRLLRVLPVVPLVVLAGCGVAGTEFHPGLAAQVGDETITSRHLDDVTDNYCTAVEKVSKGDPNGGNQQTPMRYLSHDFVSVLIDQAAAEQLAEEYDVEPSATYKSDLAQLEPQLTDLDEDEKDAVREVIGARSYTDDVLTQIGQQELQDQGSDDASPEEQLAAGRELLQGWVDDHDVEVNPRYAYEFGTDTQVDTDLSYPLGDTAKGGIKAEVDSDYTDGLPAHLVCLDYS